MEQCRVLAHLGRVLDQGRQLRLQISPVLRHLELNESHDGDILDTMQQLVDLGEHEDDVRVFDHILLDLLQRRRNFLVIHF